MNDKVVNSIKLLHCADIHLAAPFTSMGISEGKSSIRRQDLKETFQKIVNLAGCENVDLLLICGDLYEHGYINKSLIEFINYSFSKIQKTKIIIIPGNHDPYISGSYYDSNKWSPNVTILSPDKPKTYFEDLDTNIYFLGNSKFGFEYNSFASVRSSNSSTYSINILMAHGTLDMNIGPKNYNPINSRDIDKLNMDYVAIGHFHKMFRDAGKGKNIFNPGSPEPLGFDEPGSHGVFLGTIIKYYSSRSSIDINFIPVARRFYENIEVKLDGCYADQQVVEKISELLEGKNQEQGLFNVILKGYAERGYRPDIPYILSFFKDKVFSIKIEDQLKPDYNFNELKEEPGIRGLFVRKMLALIESSKDETKRKELEKALYYGMEAIDYGKVHVDLLGRE
ncbi:MAG TPA: DNA repair exonuclease [Clostridiaceae bacterium]|nr:DNA repair exonuclease [Clostridiaceae bacterium]